MTLQLVVFLLIAVVVVAAAAVILYRSLRFSAFLFMLLSELALMGVALVGIMGGWTAFIETLYASLDPGSSAYRAVRVAMDYFRPLDELSRKAYWTVLLLLPIAHWISRLAIWQRRKSFELKSTATESLSIYEEAIVQFVRTAAEEVEGVRVKNVKVSASRKGLALNVGVRLDQRINIPRVQERIESVVRQRLNEALGVDRIYRIKITVRGFGELEKKPGRLEYKGDAETAGGAAAASAAGRESDYHVVEPEEIETPAEGAEEVHIPPEAPGDETWEEPREEAGESVAFDEAAYSESEEEPEKKPNPGT